MSPANGSPGNDAGSAATSAVADDALRLPPMSRAMQIFSWIAFFALGVLGAWFVFANPLALRFLPGSADAAGPAASSRSETLYGCPMHPDVIQDEPGNCHVCGMALVALDAVDARSDASGRGAPIVYQCPMHPEVVEAEPGDCPICGMALVETETTFEPLPETADRAGQVIRIDPVQVQNTGVVSEEAILRDVARSSRTVGILDYNADRITWINTKFEGWIERARVNYVGQDLQRGDPLFEIYSPELVTTQEEYIRALDYRASLMNSGRADTLRQAESLLRSTRDRLTYWDISEEQIRRLEQTRRVERRVTIASPADGIVAEVMSEALEGMFVKPGMDLYKIADLSTVWVHADVYELDIPWIRAGQPAAVSFRNDPGRQFHGKVLFLYPEVSRDTRTLKICVEVPNPNLRLRPGMYADVVVQGPLVRDAVVIPQSAVIRSGRRNIVFLALGQGRFQPREVELGVKGEGDLIQIVRGIEPGEQVVTQAQFMLDSESRIQEAIAKFRERGSAGEHDAPPAHAH